MVYYVVQLNLFSKINQNIVNIDRSEQRLNYIIDITMRTRTLILLNKNYVNRTQAQLNTLMNSTIAKMVASATSLNKAQNDLSLSTASLPLDQQEVINPSNVTLFYKPYP